jgi:hypothetical protein
MSKKSLFVALLACVSLAGCGGAKSGDGWREVSSVDHGFIRFVEVNKDHVKDGALYADAAKSVCGGVCFQVGFFAEGSAEPPNMSRAEFFQQGGWKDYQPLAVYMGRPGEFSKWDCDRIGAEGAPPTALCGDGAKAQFDAVLSLASRVGWTKGCGLPPTEDEALVRKFIALPSQASHRGLLESEFESMRRESSGGPDNPADCKALAPRIEGNAKEARELLTAQVEAGG